MILSRFYYWDENFRYSSFDTADFVHASFASNALIMTRILMIIILFSVLQNTQKKKEEAKVGAPCLKTKKKNSNNVKQLGKQLSPKVDQF